VGAAIRTHTAVTSARGEDGLWRVVLRAADGREQEARARGLANAAGPWMENIITGVVGANSSRKARLVKGSQAR
jgi:glycerol-3-phosphate dehydrogenase